MKKRKTPRGDGNSASVAISFSIKKFIMKKRKTPGGDGNYACDNSSNDITFVSWKKEKPQ